MKSPFIHLIALSVLSIPLIITSPLTGAAYFQDTLEYRGLIVNAGIRADWWAPGKEVENVMSNPDDYLFFDGVHPTRIGHQLAGELAFQTTVPEPSTIALWSIAGLVGGFVTWRVRKGKGADTLSSR